MPAIIGHFDWMRTSIHSSAVLSKYSPKPTRFASSL